jgi:P27 family predicted phage terminase small subunit
MGLRGPAPTPTRLKVLRGDKKNRINYDEPVPELGTPEMPEDLSPMARSIWQELMPLVEHMQILSPLDKWMFAGYCESVARFRETTAVVAKVGVIMRTQDGKGIQRNPFLSAQRDSIQLMKMMAGEFGMSPRARSEIRSGRRNTPDSRERLLS